MLIGKDCMSNVKEKGFSLIELVVVLSIFLIIMGVTVDIFLSVVRSQKRILEEQELLNQISYAVEYMSTGLRMAKKAPDDSCFGSGTTGRVYELTHCLNGVLQPCNGIKFINSLDNNACTEIFLDESVNPVTPPLVEVKNGGSPANLLSNKFKIEGGNFIINGDKTIHSISDADLVQPRVTILLNVQTQSPGNQQKKIIQTTISQRNLNEP